MTGVYVFPRDVHYPGGTVWASTRQRLVHPRFSTVKKARPSNFMIIRTTKQVICEHCDEEIIIRKYEKLNAWYTDHVCKQDTEYVAGYHSWPKEGEK